LMDLSSVICKVSHVMGFSICLYKVVSVCHNYTYWLGKEFWRKVFILVLLILDFKETKVNNCPQTYRQTLPISILSQWSLFLFTFWTLEKNRNIDDWIDKVK
jgi:hypothetical protein